MWQHSQQKIKNLKMFNQQNQGLLLFCVSPADEKYLVQQNRCTTCICIRPYNTTLSCFLCDTIQYSSSVTYNRKRLHAKYHNLSDRVFISECCRILLKTRLLLNRADLARYRLHLMDSACRLPCTHKAQYQRGKKGGGEGGGVTFLQVSWLKITTQRATSKHMSTNRHY